MGSVPDRAGKGLVFAIDGSGTDGLEFSERQKGFLSASSQGTAPASAEESLEGFLETEGGDGTPAVCDRVDGTSVPFKGNGTTQDPYLYYVKKGGEVAPEVLALLVRTKTCARFVVVEDEGSVQAPLLIWTFDGKVYETAIQGEVPSETAPSSESFPETELSSEDGGEGSSEEPAESTEGEGTSSSSEETMNPDGSIPETSGTDQMEESPSDPEEVEGFFGDDALDEALGGLESVPRGYTKEELARAIRERSLEYENLELAIRKNELQAGNLRREIEENVLTSETAGQVRTAADPKEAARLGQPVLTIQGGSGNLLSGQMNEVLAAVLKPGDRLMVSARDREKEISFEAVLKSVEKETEDVIPGGGEGDPGGSGEGAGFRERFRGGFTR